MIITMIFKTTRKIVLSLSSLIPGLIIDYADYTDMQDYIKNNFLVDYAD